MNVRMRRVNISKRSVSRETSINHTMEVGPNPLLDLVVEVFHTS